MENLNRITHNPPDQPTIRDLSLTISEVLTRLGIGETFDDLLTDYPTLEPADIQQALLYGAQLITQTSTIKQAQSPNLTHLQQKWMERAEWFEQIAEMIHEIFFLIKADFSEMIYINLAYEEVWGQSRAELYANPTSWIDAIHSDDRDHMIVALQNLVQYPTEFDEIYRIIRPDDEVRWIRARAWPIFNETEEVYRFAGVAEDITEIKYAQDALTALFNHSLQGVSLVQDGHICFINQTLSHILGYPVAELLGRTMDEVMQKVIHPGDIEMVLQRAHARADGKPAPPRYQTRLIRASGEVRWVDVFATMIDYLGRPAIQVVFIDITEQKLATKNLALREKYLTTLVEVQKLLLANSLSYQGRFDQILTWLGDATQAYRVQLFENHYDANDNLLTSLQLEWCAEDVPASPTNLLQNLAYSSFSPYWLEAMKHAGPMGAALDEVPPAERALMEELGIISFMILPLAFQDQLFGFINITHANKRYYWNNMEMEIMSSVAISISSYLNRRHTNKILNEGESTLRSFYNNVPMMMGVVEVVDGDILHISDNETSAQFFGRPAKAMQDQYASAMGVPPDIISQWINHYQNCKQMGTAIQFEYTHTPPQGEALWLAATVSHILDNRFSYVVEDITERKRIALELQKAKDRAEAASKAKDTFLATMSHELRTPLNGILGYAQILQQDLNFPIQHREGLATIESSGNHLLTLINDILDMAKVEAGRTELVLHDFQLSSFIKNVCQMIALRASQKDLQYHCKMDDTLPNFVHGDEKRLRQILINLLGNAVKFTDAGQVTLRVQNLASLSDGHLIRFEVTDTGIGLPPSALEIIFEPFQQVGDYKRKAKGTGLGLAICRSLVTLMGGELQVTSTLHEGSRFWFDILLETVSDEPQLSQSITQIVGIKNQAPLKILIVDDQQTNRQMLVDLLKPLGFDIESATSCAEGLTKAKTNPPQVILVDLIMPQMDGLEFIRHIRQEPTLKEVIIIANSASAFQSQVKQSIQAGSNSFIPKPIQAKQLFRVLETYLNFEWVYAESHETPLKQPDTITPPSTDQLTILIELADIGDIGGLRRQLTELETDDHLKPFVSDVRQWVKTFQLDRIRAVLDSYK